jgi:hypothetical protein
MKRGRCGEPREMFDEARRLAYIGMGTTMSFKIQTRFSSFADWYRFPMRERPGGVHAQGVQAKR